MTQPQSAVLAEPRPLTASEHRVLLDVAVTAIEHRLRTGELAELDLASLPPRLRLPDSAFVTLRRGGRLLGCVGGLQARQPLGADVHEHAVAAAFHDPRFPAISIDDFEQMTVGVSVLGPQQPLPASGHADLRLLLRPGVDGLVVAAPGHRATFLPSVWEQVRDADQFCALLWRKAGLQPGAWPPGLVVSTYQVDQFEQAGPRAFSC